jgi:predicted RNase H-like nuclease (RuvC/YqgF family)
MGEQVTLTDASKMVDQHPAVLRRFIGEGKLKSSKNTSGHHVVDKTEVLAFFADRSAKRSGASRGSDRASKSEGGDQVAAVLTERIASLEGTIADLRRTIEREREENKDLRSQNRELQGEILKITHELKGYLAKEGGNMLSRWIKSKATG